MVPAGAGVCAAAVVTVSAGPPHRASADRKRVAAPVADDCTASEYVPGPVISALRSKVSSAVPEPSVRWCSQREPGSQVEVLACPQ